MPLSLTERFYAEHFTLQSISPSRQRHVRMAIDRLAAFLDRPIEEADPNDLRLWMASMMEAGNVASTTAFYLKAVRPFYRWCWLSNVISADAWLRIAEVHPPRGSNHSVPRPYSRKEITRLYAELDERYPYTTDLILRRWRKGTSPYNGNIKFHVMRIQLEAIIELALICGLRRSEIYNLTIDDVHWDNKYIVVSGKRHDQHEKFREVPYPDSTREAVQRWFRMRGLLGPEPGVRLWLSITGSQPTTELRPERMDNILHGNWTLHRLRHTCATERLRAGMKLEQLQRFLGHASLQQTLAYAQLVRSDVHKASEQIDKDLQRAIGRPKKVEEEK